MPRRAWWITGSVWGFFMVIMGLISFPNHYTFRTFGLDLGYSLQVLHYHSKGVIVPRALSMTNPNLDEENWRTDSHASPSILTALPFYLIGGAWGLLVHQWLLVGFMAIGMFAYSFQRTQSWQAGLWTMIHFFGMWGVTSFMAWDWHEVITGIAWLPWFFYAIEQRKLWLSILSWLLFIGGKENFALWGIWISLILLLVYRHSEQRRLLLYFLAIAGVWFVSGYYLYKGGEGGVSRLSVYEYLASQDPIGVLQGKGEKEPFSLQKVAKTILLRPQLIWTLLFESPYPDMVGVKSELHWAVLWSGGWSFWFSPIWLAILVPVYLYKLLFSDPQIWGTLYHYSMEYAAILPIAVLWAVQRWRGTVWFWVALIGSALAAHIMNLSLLDHRYSKWYGPDTHRWYSERHYRSFYCYPKIHEGLKLIPRDAPVSAVSRLVPHIPPREEYYHFPAHKQADYIALLRNDPNPWPLSKAQLYAFIDSVEKLPSWEKVWDRDQLVIFRRKKSIE